MSDIWTLSLAPSWRAELRAMFPWITPALIQEFGLLATRAELFTDALEFHPAFLDWCARVARGGGAAPAVATPGPAPKPLTSGAEVLL